jgi:hypothetical protein
MTTGWVLAALLHFAPVGQWDRSHWADESHEAALQRYRGIATAIESVCALSKGPVRDCESLLVALAVGESGLAKDADLGPCYRRGNWWRRCDAGKAASAWQAQAHGFDLRPNGDGKRITVARLFADRELAAWQALRVARNSLSLCRDLAPEDRLSALSGRCHKGDGPWRNRWRLWGKVKAWIPSGT